MIESALAQNQNHGIVGLNHVALSVSNINEAVTYYTKTMGFPEAFRSTDNKGQATLVYLQVGKDTFVELLAANAQRPPGFNHFGLVVEDMSAAVNMFKQRGARVADPRRTNGGGIVANITDPNGMQIELAELTPESRVRQAIERWK
jgi:catechol 2,3-dioxygenase-like lactoylglutathione lyase family enzyme